MKRFIKFLFPIFILLTGVLSGKLYLIYKDFRQNKKSESSKCFPVKEQKPFVVIIPSYNNEKWCKKNIESVLDQKYQNYRVIYIDDRSQDQTFSKVKNLIKRTLVNFTMIHNKTRKGALNNIYDAIYTCKDNEIVVILDGDDWFSHDKILNKLNEIYANPEVWITYGQYITYPNYQKGHCRKVASNELFRNYDWVFSHLKTFYASLFKKIKKEDLLLHEHFYQMTSDLAFMLPMLEMARLDHIQFVPDILYIYNRCNPINDDKMDRSYQLMCEKSIRSKIAYEPLTEL